MLKNINFLTKSRQKEPIVRRSTFQWRVVEKLAFLGQRVQHAANEALPAFPKFRLCVHVQYKRAYGLLITFQFELQLILHYVRTCLLYSVHTYCILSFQFGQNPTMMFSSSGL